MVERDHILSRDRHSFVADSNSEMCRRTAPGLTTGGTYDPLLIDSSRRIILSPDTSIDVTMIGGTVEAVVGGSITANVAGDYPDDSAFTLGTDRALAVGGVTPGGTFRVTGVDDDRRLTVKNEPEVSDVMQNSRAAVNANSETNVLSYIIGGTPIRIYNWMATGTAEAEYFLYIGGVKKIVHRTSAADRTVNETFPSPIEVTSGSFVVRVKHYESGAQDFDASVVYGSG